jgi:outer membrane protein TolC
MKKLICTSLALLLALGGVTVAFAAETPKTTVAAASTTTSAVETNNATSSAIISTDSAVRTIAPDMTFIGTPIKLSLQDANKKILNDSPGKIVADYNKKNTIAISQGYLENVQSINDGTSPLGTGKNTREIQRALRDYAGKQAEPNYQAELNKLKVDTLTNYYQLKQLEELERIAKETLDLKAKLLSNTQLKFKLGTVSNNDVLQAESAVNQAKDDLSIAQNKLSSKKMAFNTFMGYDLMQNVTLTDSLKQVALPTKTLESSIKDALVNRNEIKAAEFGLQYAKLNFEVYKDYPKSSSSYLKKQIAIVEAEKTLHDTNDGMEMDVRIKYMDMQQKYAAIQTGLKTVENAKEGLRLTQLQYDAGMATLTNVNEAQITYNQSEVSLSSNMLDYNLAVEAYNYAGGVGTTAATIN